MTVITSYSIHYTKLYDETAEIAFDDLVVDDVIDVFGADDEAEPGCVLADTIQKYAMAP